MSSESGVADNNVVTDWKSKLPEICKNYDARDIFNMDKSGLFFCNTTNKSFHVKGDDCHDGKQSKESITISLCANMLGEKEHLLVTGKSAKPRRFRNISSSQLPASYYHNKKAWMTSAIFDDWVKSFDRQKSDFVFGQCPITPQVDLQKCEIVLPTSTHYLESPAYGSRNYTGGEASLS